MILARERLGKIIQKIKRNLEKARMALNSMIWSPTQQITKLRSLRGKPLTAEGTFCFYRSRPWEQPGGASWDGRMWCVAFMEVLFFKFSVWKHQ